MRYHGEKQIKNLLFETKRQGSDRKVVECPCNISLVSRHGGAGTGEVIWSEIALDV